MKSFCFINNQIVAASEAKIGINDLGFQRGYGVFDFAPVYNGKVFHLKKYLQRFYRSAAGVFLKIPYSERKIEEIIYELLSLSDIKNPAIRLMITGGYSDINLTLSKPNFIINAEEITGIDPVFYKNGIHLATYEFQREMPEIKTLNYLNSIWLEQYKKQKEADEILYYNAFGVTECPRNNVFLLKGKTLITPAEKILRGITRELVLDFTRQRYLVEERNVTVEEIIKADEVFLTSTRKRILPVTKINGKKIGNGIVGNETAFLMDYFKDYINNYS